MPSSTMYALPIGAVKETVTCVPREEAVAAIPALAAHLAACADDPLAALDLAVLTDIRGKLTQTTKPPIVAIAKEIEANHRTLPKALVNVGRALCNQLTLTAGKGTWGTVKALLGADGEQFPDDATAAQIDDGVPLTVGQNEGWANALGKKFNALVGRKELKETVRSKTTDVGLATLRRMSESDKAKQRRLHCLLREVMWLIVQLSVGPAIGLFATFAGTRTLVCRTVISPDLILRRLALYALGNIACVGDAHYVLAFQSERVMNRTFRSSLKIEAPEELKIAALHAMRGVFEVPNDVDERIAVNYDVLPYHLFRLAGQDRRVTPRLLFEALSGMPFATCNDDAIDQCLEIGLIDATFGMFRQKFESPKPPRAQEIDTDTGRVRRAPNSKVSDPVLSEIFGYVPGFVLRERELYKLSRPFFYNVICDKMFDGTTALKEIEVKIEDMHVDMRAIKSKQQMRARQQKMKADAEAARRAAVIIDGGTTPWSRLLNPVLDLRELDLPLVRTCATTCSGSDEATSAMVRAGVLECIESAVFKGSHKVKKEAIWALSNIGANDVGDNAIVVKRTRLMREVVRCAMQAGSADTHETRLAFEACVTIGNMMQIGTTHAVRTGLLGAGAMMPMIVISRYRYGDGQWLSILNDIFDAFPTFGCQTEDDDDSSPDDSSSSGSSSSSDDSGDTSSDTWSDESDDSARGAPPPRFRTQGPGRGGRGRGGGRGGSAPPAANPGGPPQRPYLIGAAPPDYRIPENKTQAMLHSGKRTKRGKGELLAAELKVLYLKWKLFWVDVVERGASMRESPTTVDGKSSNGPDDTTGSPSTGFHTMTMTAEEETAARAADAADPNHLPAPSLELFAELAAREPSITTDYYALFAVYGVHYLAKFGATARLRRRLYNVFGVDLERPAGEARVADELVEYEGSETDLEFNTESDKDDDDEDDEDSRASMTDTTASFDDAGVYSGADISDYE